MKKVFFNSNGIWPPGSALARIIIGLMMIKLGIEIFDRDQVNGYGAWLKDLGFPMPVFIAYLGKGAELVGGVSPVTGFLASLMMIPLVITMAVISFVMIKPDVFGDSQNRFFNAFISARFLFHRSGHLES
jgi:putative oxidoreductase